ncbi:MAG TPA: DUF3536 domain-containing protein [Egicoccus sp.]|nr:DUF3536 domain-containing protein [Egicoccus sp.]HSK24525.1 DUF3536 domain-containing protein [Egicoccus sp.]
MDRYICVHGHFYQPPRENPWLEQVEQQDTAWPFHDWNERITAECYGPNTSARILDDDGRIRRLVNNYARMSFNVGPTLLAWMADHAPDVHAGIVDADRRSAERFGGHGSAMAQVYNHAIMPLANARDQQTQVVWGLRDFEHRFGRAAEGMWLAETAADTDSLEVLAANGVTFTVLSPYQAAVVRPLPGPGPDPTEGEWLDVTGGRVDPTRPYRVNLPSGRHLDVFFYDARVSQSVAFEGLLNSGDRLADRLLHAFPERGGPKLVNIATDGESYGHHHRHGEMALAHALHRLSDSEEVRLTNYGEYLELFPPEYEARIVEDSSWSCAHGIERWRSDCGCTNGDTGGRQAWRAPLRDALDHLRDQVGPAFETAAKRFLRDPWQARDDYVEMLLDRTTGTQAAFLDRHAARPLSDDDRVEVLRLLELQRHALLMYTSCGWFFDELSRIETVQVLAYAARVIEIAEQVLDLPGLEAAFLDRLAQAPSNLALYGDGRTVYEQLVQPARANFRKVAAHFAISGLFRRYGRTEQLGCYEVERIDEHTSEAGRAKVGYGRISIRSTVTQANNAYEYGVIHFGDHNFLCGVREAGADEAYATMCAALSAAFDEANFPDTIRTLDEHFGRDAFSLRDLFRDEQRRLLDVVLDTTLLDVENTYRSIYRGRGPLLRFLAGLDAKVPPALRSAAEVVINAELRDALAHNPDPERVTSLIEEADRFRVTLDTDGLAHALTGTLGRIAQAVDTALDDDATFATFGAEQEAMFVRFATLIDIAETLPFEVDLGRAQNLAWRVRRERRPWLAERGDAAARAWIEAIDDLTVRLGFAL